MDITSANSIVILNVIPLFPSGVLLQKFSADQSVVADEETFAETRMGVDGRLAAGYTPTIKPVSITLEADSESIMFMDDIISYQQTVRKPAICNLIVTVPSIYKSYKYLNGVLKSGTTMPGHKKVLDPVTYKFEFEIRLPQPM